MSKTPKSPAIIGDSVIRIVPALSTSDTLDNEVNRERARRAEDDARAAQHSAGDEESEAGRASAEAAVDASIEEARARAANGTTVPILLRDPVTGAIIEQE